MPLNPSAVGAVGDIRTMSWNSKDALLYAVGIGAGQSDLPFTTENTKDIQQVVFPTFAVVAGSGTASAGKSAMSDIGSFNFAMLVHHKQSTKPISTVHQFGGSTTRGLLHTMQPIRGELSQTTW